MTPGSNIGATAAEDRADRSPADSLAQAITDVAALHADTCDLDHPASPSATVAILQEQPEAVDCLVLGDTTIH
jgi:hypothetical protein